MTRNGGFIEGVKEAGQKLGRGINSLIGIESENEQGSDASYSLHVAEVEPTTEQETFLPPEEVPADEQLPEKPAEETQGKTPPIPQAKKFFPKGGTGNPIKDEMLKTLDAISDIMKEMEKLATNYLNAPDRVNSDAAYVNLLKERYKLHRALGKVDNCAGAIMHEFEVVKPPRIQYAFVDDRAGECLKIFMADNSKAYYDANGNPI